MSKESLQNLSKSSKKDDEITPLKDNQIKAIELLLTGCFTHTDIALQCGVRRQTLYNWLQNPDFKAELDQRRLELQAKIGSSWFSIFSISTDGLLQRVKAGDIDSQEFALKCMMSTMNKDGKGFLLIPDNTGTSLSKELDSIVTKERNIQKIIENLKIMIDPKTKREDFIQSINMISHYAVALYTDDELDSFARCFNDKAIEKLQEIKEITNEDSTKEKIDSMIKELENGNDFWI